MSDEREIDRCVEGAAAAHQRLLATLDRLVGLDTGDPRQSSLLPGWSVGHVLSHLARNADSHRRMFEAAGEGRVADQYADGEAGREREIESGSSRPLPELVDDVRRSIWALEQAWAGATAVTWAGEGRTVRGLVPVADLPFRRWREVEVHHADLGVGCTYEDWSGDYVRRELARRLMSWRASTPMGMSGLPAAALELAPSRRLAWLLGRESVPGLADIEEW